MRLDPKLIDRIDTDLRAHLGTNRYAHVMGVKQMAAKLAVLYGEDPDKATLAALLHDYVKWMSPHDLLRLAEEEGLRIPASEREYPKVLHAIVGARVARRTFKIEDPAILNAIRNHTTGDAGMGLLEKILFVADYSEPNRTHPLAPVVREKALGGWLEEACLLAADGTLEYLIQKRALIHPRTIAARNDFLKALARDGNLPGTEPPVQPLNL